MDEIKQKDYLNINIINKDLLMYQTKDGPRSFTREQLLKQTRISKQMKQDDASNMLVKSSESLKNTMNIVVIV